MRHADMAPVAVRFWSPVWNGRGVLVEDDRELRRRRVNVPAEMALLNGATAVPPEQAGGEVGVEGREGGGDLGLLDRRVVDRGQRAGPRARSPAGPVFNGVGSKPPTGMPWAPSEMTRTTSELSRPIRIASWRVICQISCASGSLVVRGRVDLGHGDGSELRGTGPA